MTALIHGDDGLAAAQRITEALFSGELADLSVADLEQLRLDGLPSAELSRGDLLERPLTQLLADVGMAAGKQVKDALGRNAVWVNTVAAGMDDNMKAAEVFAAEKALGDG